MKRLLIPFVAAFGLSLGVATGVAMVRTPKAPVVVAKLAPVQGAVAKPDSASSTAVVADTLPPSTATPNASVSPTPASAAAPVMLASAQLPQASSATPTNVEPGVASVAAARRPAVILKAQPAVAHALTPLAAPDTVTGKKLAKVFGAMQAKDASRVLEQMDDADVRTILAALSNKQQAAILGTFPTQRAATIMRATLRDTGGDQ